MKTTMTRTADVRSQIGGAAIALGLAVILGVAYAAPARADDDDHRGRSVERDHHDRDRGDYRDHREYRSYGYDRPAYVYSPPPVYYHPPPGPPVIDFVFPLHFR
jgi:hypothetical protein